MKSLTLALTLSLLAAGCSSSDQSTSVSDEQSPGVSVQEDADEDASLAQVPQASIDAALAAVPGLVLDEAEREGNGVFCLHGYVNGVFTEVEVDSDGNVIEIESGDDDDDGDEDEGAGEEEDDDDED